ncbi:MAG: hypothetical protein ACE366_08695 [Bradymonadia bacterium]
MRFVSKLALAGTAAFWAVTQTACTDEYTLPNVAPEVQAIAYCQQNDRTYLVLEVFDIERDPIDVSIQVSGAPCGGSSLAVGPTGSGVIGLNSERADHPRRISGERPEVHLIEWASGDDVQYLCAAEQETTNCCVLEAAAPNSIEVRLSATDSDNFNEAEWQGSLSLSAADCTTVIEAMADGTQE